MENTHTSGPWTAQILENSRNGYEWPTFTIRDARNICVAVVGEVDRATAEDNAANAHLIAAAPALLAALKIIAAGYILDQGTAGLGCLSIDLTISRNIALAAIAKAEGGAV